MHMWVIYGERHLSRTLKKSPYPGRGSNRGPFDLEASTLPRRCKSRLVPQAVRTHGAPYRGYGYVSLRFGGNVVRKMGTQQQQAVQVYDKPNQCPVTPIFTFLVYLLKIPMVNH